MNKEEHTIICISCPLGCTLKAEKQEGGYVITGNRCPKGEKYALKEMTNPERGLQTTVKTVFSDFPRLPVKIDKEIPLEDIFRYMQAINRLVVEKRMKPGEVIKRNILGKGVNVVSTGDMRIY